MTKIIRNQQIVDDDWTTLADDAPMPTSGPKNVQVILSLERWKAERDAHKTSDTAVGVRIANTVNVTEVWPLLADRPLIAVEFPAFGDGRAYSQARVLRERYGYQGEIRAVGDVLRDQMYEKHRCGINAMVPRSDQDLDACLAAIRDFTEPYQGAADSSMTVFKRRASA